MMPSEAEFWAVADMWQPNQEQFFVLVVVDATGAWQVAQLPARAGLSSRNPGP
jgi:hypothetical protein